MSIEILKNRRDEFLAKARNVFERFGANSPRVLNAVHFAREINRAIVLLKKAEKAGLL